MQSAFLELVNSARHVASELAEELRQMQAWLELGKVEVANRGNLATDLRRALRTR